MVARALWGSEARGLCLGRRPYTSLKGVQERSQCTTLKLENYYFFTFTFSRPEVGKLLPIYFFTFSRPEVGKLLPIYFFTFSRPARLISTMHGLSFSIPFKTWIYLMAGRSFVVAKEEFIMETVVFWHCDKGLMTKTNSFCVSSAMSIIICTRWLISIT